ncbi:MAG: ZIP family metal transporter [Planctomycetaceae bacterium]
MTTLYILLAVYCGMIVVASLAGGWLPGMIRLTHGRMQGMMSVVGGLMLGIALFHMLPHAVHHLGSVHRTMHWVAGGLLSMFFLIRAFHFHQHGPAEIADEASEEEAVVDEELSRHAGHPHAHVPHHHHHGPGAAHRLSWMGVATGLAVHTLIDGLALGASMQADVGRGAMWSLFGLQTFLAILLHKPLDAVSITSLMAAGGWTPAWRNAVNVGFALMCPLGAGLFFLGVTRLADHHDTIVGCALAFSAGVFLCISLGDLLPEMEWHSHDRLRLSALLLLGIGIAYAVERIQPHDHGGPLPRIEAGPPPIPASRNRPDAAQPQPNATRQKD